MIRSSRHRIKHLLKLRSIKVLTVILVIAATLAILELTDVTHLFNKTKVPPIIPVNTPSTVTSPPASSATGGSEQKASSPKDKEPATTDESAPTNVNLPLYAPYGAFVSNHTPGAGGSPTTEDSVCNTTPGAKCYIKFTKDGTTSQLPTQLVGSDGSTRWSSWEATTLSSGSWTITAVATLNGQTKTTQDQTPLIIK